MISLRKRKIICHEINFVFTDRDYGLLFYSVNAKQQCRHMSLTEKNSELALRIEAGRGTVGCSDHYCNPLSSAIILTSESVLTSAEKPVYFLPSKHSLLISSQPTISASVKTSFLPRPNASLPSIESNRAIEPILYIGVLVKCR